MPKYTYQDRDNNIMSVPEGDYVFGVAAAEMRLSKQGNDMIELRLRLLGPFEDGKMAEKGPLVYDYLVFGEKSEWKIDVFLKAIQKAPSKGAEVDITDDWLKREVTGALGWAHFSLEEYNGKKNNKVAFYISKRSANQGDPYKLFAREGEGEL